MPKLKQLICSVELFPSTTKLKEYGTKYTDGSVETFIAVPRDPTRFAITLTQDGYIAPGIAMFVFMDGVYQCNRNRRDLKLPGDGVPLNQTQVDFRVHQKEDVMKDTGKFVARDWTFEELDTVEADKAEPLNPNFLHNAGTIEVVIMRCKNEGEAVPTPQTSFEATMENVKPSKRAANKETASSPPESSIGGFGGLFDGPSDREIEMVVHYRSKPSAGASSRFNAEKCAVAGCGFVINGTVELASTDSLEQSSNQSALPARCADSEAPDELRAVDLDRICGSGAIPARCGNGPSDLETFANAETVPSMANKLSPTEVDPVAKPDGSGSPFEGGLADKYNLDGASDQRDQQQPGRDGNAFGQHGGSSHRGFPGSSNMGSMFYDEAKKEWYPRGAGQRGGWSRDDRSIVYRSEDDRLKGIPRVQTVMGSDQDAEQHHGKRKPDVDGPSTPIGIYQHLPPGYGGRTGDEKRKDKGALRDHGISVPVMTADDQSQRQKSHARVTSQYQSYEQRRGPGNATSQYLGANPAYEHDNAQFQPPLQPQQVHQGQAPYMSSGLLSAEERLRKAQAGLADSHNLIKAYENMEKSGQPADPERMRNMHAFIFKSNAEYEDAQKALLAQQHATLQAFEAQRDQHQGGGQQTRTSYHAGQGHDNTGHNKKDYSPRSSTYEHAFEGYKKSGNSGQMQPQAGGAYMDYKRAQENKGDAQGGWGEKQTGLKNSRQREPQADVGYSTYSAYERAEKNKGDAQGGWKGGDSHEKNVGNNAGVWGTGGGGDNWMNDPKYQHLRTQQNAWADNQNADQKNGDANWGKGSKNSGSRPASETSGSRRRKDEAWENRSKKTEAGWGDDNKKPASNGWADDKKSADNGWGDDNKKSANNGRGGTPAASPKINAWNDGNKSKAHVTSALPKIEEDEEDFQPKFKPYWAIWNNPAKNSKFLHPPNSNPNVSIRREPRDPYIYPAEETPKLPADVAEKRGINRAITTGKGAPYVHRCERPQYLDTVQKPYAVFSFKYRSKEVLEEMLGKNLDDEMAKVEEVGAKANLMTMSRVQLVEELYKLKVSSPRSESKSGGSAAGASRPASRNNAW